MFTDEQQQTTARAELLAALAERIFLSDTVSVSTDCEGNPVLLFVESGAIVGDESFTVAADLSVTTHNSMDASTKHYANTWDVLAEFSH